MVTPPIYAATLAELPYDSEVVWLLIRADLEQLFDAAARRYAPESLPANWHFEIGNVDTAPLDDADTVEWEWPPSIGFGFTIDLKDGSVTMDPLTLEHAEAAAYISDRVDHDEET